MLLPAPAAQTPNCVPVVAAPQKLLECNPLAARARLAGTLRGSVVQLSLHMYGCRVVQRALELLPSDLQCEMLRELIDADGQVRCSCQAACRV